MLGFVGIGLAEVRAPELALELLDPAGGVDEFLLAGKERMALAAQVDVKLGDGASSGEGVLES